MKPIMMKKIERVVQTRFNLLNNIKSSIRVPKGGLIIGNKPVMQRRDSLGNVLNSSLARKPNLAIKKN